MTKYILTPEQAHGLVDAAYSCHPDSVPSAHLGIEALKGYGEFFAILGNYCAAVKQVTEGYDRVVCWVHSERARAYLAANGIKGEVEA